MTGYEKLGGGDPELLASILAWLLNEVDAYSLGSDEAMAAVGAVTKARQK